MARELDHRLRNVLEHGTPDCFGAEAEPNRLFRAEAAALGIFSTCLDVLLSEIGARELILTGIAADICVLLTAHDAHVRTNSPS